MTDELINLAYADSFSIALDDEMQEGDVVALPKFVGTASVYSSSESYFRAGSPSMALMSGTAIAQHDPCDRSSGGGVTLPPTACPRGRKCCGTIANNKCLGQCVPNNAACP